MGVRFTRTAVIAAGKRDEALAFTAEVASYVEEHFGTAVTWGLQLGGTVGKIHWYSDYENLAEFEKLLGQTMTDEGYLKVIETAGDLFVAAPEDTLVYTM